MKTMRNHDWRLTALLKTAIMRPKVAMLSDIKFYIFYRPSLAPITLAWTSLSEIIIIYCILIIPQKI